MTVVPVQLPETAHAGDGVTTTFLIGFDLPSTAELRVDVSRVTLEYEVGYAVVGSNVVFAAPPADAAPIWFRRVSPIGQSKEFPTQPTMKPLAVEAALNERARVDQELGAQMVRSLAVPIGEAGITILAKADREGFLPQFADGGLTRFDEAEKVVTTDADGRVIGLSVINLMQTIGVDIIDDGQWSPDDNPSLNDDGVWG